MAADYNTPKKVAEHKAVCRQCGAPIHYYGRRDLLEVVTRALKILEPVVMHEEGVHPEMRACVAWDALLGPVLSAQGKCWACDRPTTPKASPPVLVTVDVRPTSKGAPGHCSECGWPGPGIGSEERCPVLGCPGTIVRPGTVVRNGR